MTETITANPLQVSGTENKRYFPADTLVVQVPFGGLGDHLFYSHIPSIAKKSGKYSKVLVSDKSDFRNTLYKDLIWKTNPFVDGFTERGGWYPEVSDCLEGCNLLDTIMIGYDLDDGKRYHEPEVYFDVPFREELKDKQIYDPNFISNAGRIGPKKLKQYFKRPENKVDLQMKTSANYQNLALAGVPEISASSFIDYCSIIISAKRFICLTSGGATLAPALKKGVTVLYGARIKPKFHHSKMNNYVFIEADKKSLYKKIINKIKSFAK